MCSWKVNYFLEQIPFYMEKMFLVHRSVFWENFLDYTQNHWYFPVTAEIILNYSLSNFILITVAVILRKSDRPVSIAHEFWELLGILRQIFDSLLMPNGHMKSLKVFSDSWKVRFISNILNTIRITETLQAGLINWNVN